MHIEHCHFLSWFSASCESHEQDGERLRGKQQHLAILLICVSNLAHLQEAILIGSCLSPAAVRRPAKSANASCIRFG
jgi:hypothetical protein